MLFKVLRFLKASFVEQKNVMLLRNEAVVEINRSEVKDFPFNSLKKKATLNKGILFNFNLRLWQMSVFIYYQWMFMSDISHYVLLWKKSLD